MAAPSTRLRLRVSPGARAQVRGGIGRHGEGWKVRVAAPPEGGKATEAVLRLLADRLGVPNSSRDKIVHVSGIDQAEAARRLEQAGAR